MKQSINIIQNMKKKKKHEQNLTMNRSSNACILHGKQKGLIGITWQKQPMRKRHMKQGNQSEHDTYRKGSTWHEKLVNWKLINAAFRGRIPKLEGIKGQGSSECKVHFTSCLPAFDIPKSCAFQSVTIELKKDGVWKLRLVVSLCVNVHF